jgi:proteic killer suppression protein
VIRSFADAATLDLYDGRDSKVARRRVTKDLWHVVRRRLDALNAASNLQDLGAVPGTRLEALKGDQRGRNSIRMNDQYRITFRFEHGHAYDVQCEDYH